MARDYVGVSAFAAEEAARRRQAGAEFARRSIVQRRYPLPALIYTYLNRHDRVVGGNAPEKLALRPAIALGFDDDEFIKVFYGDQALPAVQILPPGRAVTTRSCRRNDLRPGRRARAARPLRLPRSGR